jgi:ankyrin repeat protein
MNATAVPSQETIDQFVGNTHGNLAVVKELLEKYPSIVSANASWIETAIEAAAQISRVEIVNCLIDHGADYDICTAAVLGSLDCLDEFLKEDPNQVNTRGAYGIPILYFPVIRANSDVAKYLLQHGADSNAAFPGGITPLHSAVMFDQPKMALWLFDHSVDPNPKYDGKFLLAMALEKKQSEMVDLLRSHGGNDRIRC